MALQHLFSRNQFGLAAARPRHARPRLVSAQFAHLADMTATETDQTLQDVRAGRQDALEACLTIQELADELGVRCQALYDLRSQGRGPTGFRIGRHLRFRRSEIDAWLSRLEQEDQARHESSSR